MLSSTNLKLRVNYQNKEVSRPIFKIFKNLKTVVLLPLEAIQVPSIWFQLPSQCKFKIQITNNCTMLTNREKKYILGSSTISKFPSIIMTQISKCNRDNEKTALKIFQEYPKEVFNNSTRIIPVTRFSINRSNRKHMIQSIYSIVRIMV